jgi:hypothetical protein
LESVSLKRRYYDAVDTNFIVDVLNLPWFHRTWPIQELVLAHKAILMYDSVQLPWPDFIDSLEKLQYDELVMTLVYTSHSNPASYYDDTECNCTLAELIRGPNRDFSISAVLGLVRSKLPTKSDDKVYWLYGISMICVSRNCPKSITIVQYTKHTLDGDHGDQVREISRYPILHILTATRSQTPVMGPGLVQHRIHPAVSYRPDLRIWLIEAFLLLQQNLFDSQGIHDRLNCTHRSLDVYRHGDFPARVQCADEHARS